MKLLSICVSPSSVASALLFEIFFSAPCHQFLSVCILHLGRKVSYTSHKTTSKNTLYLTDVFIRQICTSNWPQNDAGRSFAWPAAKDLK